MAIFDILIAAFVLSASVYQPVSAIWETDAAVSGWIVNINRTYLENALTSNVQPAHRYSIVWRSRTVPDQRARDNPTIDAENELLWRWDNRHPSDIFPIGFAPRQDLATVLGGSFSNSAVNLRSYVADAANTPSVYVSTTRRDWTPRNRGSLFRYDIFAPGGIDVNPTLGSHRYSNQEEIAFVGGIRSEYIFGAVEFDIHRRQVRYHLNPFYSGPNNTRTARRNRCTLPVEGHESLTRRDQPFFCGASQQRSKRTTDPDDIMRTPGYFVDADGNCTFWYKLQITTLTFDQPSEVGQIEPFGYIKAFTRNPDFMYERSDVWRQQPGNGNTPSVSKGLALSQLAKCLVLQSGTDTDQLSVCFNGDVDEFDPASENDDLAPFNYWNCKDTNPNTSPSLSYTVTETGAEGSVQIRFKVERCDEACIQSAIGLSGPNGRC